MGTTHLTVLAANYLAGVRREPVAVLDMGGHGALLAMGTFCGKGTGSGKKGTGSGKTGIPGGGGSFRLLEVDYYAEAGAGELALCLNRDYRRILVDCGEIAGTSLWECARYDRKVIVGSLSEWQADAFLDTFGMEGERDGSWNYAVSFGSEDARRELEKTFHRKCLRIPASVDAFAVTWDVMRFLEGLLF